MQHHYADGAAVYRAAYVRGLTPTPNCGSINGPTSTSASRARPVQQSPASTTPSARPTLESRCNAYPQRTQPSASSPWWRRS